MSNTKDNLKKIIEVGLPLKSIGKEASYEKGVLRHGHPSALHIWWARKPLGASRIIIFSSLVNQDLKDKFGIGEEFLVELSKWENSNNTQLLNRAKDAIYASYKGEKVQVLDPFAGGGSIPFEALRLGCNVYAGDYNPVSVIILKSLIELPYRFIFEFRPKGYNLIKDLEEATLYIERKVFQEIGSFYPEEEDGSKVVSYLWARTIPCDNPLCGIEIPLVANWWLTKKKNKKVALLPFIMDQKVYFKVVGDTYINQIPSQFNPNIGTVQKGIVQCPKCGMRVEPRKVRALFCQKKNGEKIIAVVIYNKKKGKIYREATIKDMDNYKAASIYLVKKQKEFLDNWGSDPLPNEPLPPLGTLGFRVQKYGFKSWGELFNDRQKLALISFLGAIRSYKEKLIKDGYEVEYVKMIITYLSLILARMTDFMNSFCEWHTTWEMSAHLFSRQAFPMKWDYSELNPFSPVVSGTWKSMARQIIKALKYIIESIEYATKR